ncbi:MAG: hypothetical protein J6112_04725, partial [Clostridia bacterium]|nr:hypothetical protein [Clostridia bacterium]
MDRHILSEISSEGNNENTILEPTVLLDISAKIPCKIGSLDEMASSLRDAIMPILAERLGKFMIEMDALIKKSPERKNEGYLVKESNISRTYTTVVGEVS